MTRAVEAPREFDPAAAEAVATKSVVRPEIQALRALAVIAVVLNHLWPIRVTGGFLGVDMFFAISGYLITGHLVREVQSTGALRIGRFWLRRVRRLLPASLLVLFVVAVATWAWLPHATWTSVFSQVAASAAYFENWVLSANAVDYFASRSDPTPVMHYWSLSAEEQFYLVWPVVILIAIAASRRVRNRRSSSVWTVALLAFVTTLSLGFSAWVSVAAPDSSYFNTAARAWQFGLGGLLALLGARLAVRSGPQIRSAVSYLGWFTILGSMILITGDFALPGVVSVFPVVGTLLVIWAGSPASRWSITRAVRIPAVQWLGNISYSLYLWHWPIIVFWPIVFAVPLGTAAKIMVFALSIGLAYLTKRFVEDPVRNARYLVFGPLRRHLWIAGATAIVIGVSLTGIAVVKSSAASAIATIEQSTVSGCVGAAAMATDTVCQSVHELSTIDLAVAASEDMSGKVDHGKICMQNREDTEVLTCEFGASKEAATLTVALVGDSHAGHWIGALNAIAEKESWRVVEYMKSSCPGVLSDTLEANWYGEGAAACHDWTSAMVSDLATRTDVDVVITSSISREYLETPVVGGAKTAVSTASYQATWDTWVASGKKVIVIADTPRWNIGDVPTCVSASGTHDPCAVPVVARTGDPMADAVTSRPTTSISVVDMDDYFCDATQCHVAIGGIVAIGDGNHMTRTFSISLAPYLSVALKNALGLTP